MKRRDQIPLTTADPEESESLLIGPALNTPSLGLGELWRCRELIGLLAWRDVAVRYRHFILGPAWALIQPVFLMVICTIFFGRLAKVPSDGTPYALFSYCGMVVWQFFSSALSASSSSVPDNGGLVS